MISKNKKLFLKIYIPFVILTIIALIVLQNLGSKKRIGYLADFHLNIERTLELNNLEDIKKDFSINGELDEEGIKNYLLTNENITNYVHHFRIRYYDKTFRNNDIYGVYPDLSNLPDYMKNAEMEENGSPYGNFISDKKTIEEDRIDNINYVLKIKKSTIITLVMLLSTIIFIYLILLLFINYFININQAIMLPIFLILLMLINRYYMFNSSYVRFNSYIIIFMFFIITLYLIYIVQYKSKFFSNVFTDVYNIFIKDRVYMICLFVSFLIVYGFELSHFTYDCDDHVYLLGINSEALLVQERVVSFILKTIFDTDIFVAFYRDILGVIMISLGSIFWTLYFYRMYNKNNLGLSKIVFLILFISHPILTYYTIFSIYTTGIIYMLSGLALLLYKNFIANKNIYSFLLIVILVFLFGFIYEIGFLFFVSGVVYGLLLYSMNDDNIQSFKIYRFYILSFIAICFLAIILKTIFANALILLNEATKSYYTERLVKWNLKDIKSNFEIIKNLIIPFNILYKYKLLPYSIVILILTICLSIIKKNYYILILGIISIYTSILMVLITGDINLYLRPMIPSMIFIAFSLFLINLLCKDKSILKVFVFILSIYIFLIQARDTNYNYQNNYTRYELDKFIALNIIKEIQKVTEQYNKPIYFAGELNGYEHLKTYKKDYKNINFSNEIEVIGSTLNNIYSIPGFFEFLGFQIDMLESINNKILLKQAEYNAQSMPAYPKEGFVRDFDDYIIVKLSE